MTAINKNGEVYVASICKKNSLVFYSLLRKMESVKILFSGQVETSKEWFSLLNSRSNRHCDL